MVAVLSVVLILFSWVVIAAQGGKCPSLMECGDIGNITFPFTSTQHPDCGIFVIHGCDDREPNVQKSIKNKERWFDIVDLQQFTITIRDDKLHDMLLQRSCQIFDYESSFTGIKGESVVVVSDDPDPSNNLKRYCPELQLPTSYQVSRNLDPKDLFNFTTADIAIEIQLSPDCVSCHDIHGGQCRLDNGGKFYCHQGTRAYTLLCLIHKQNKRI
ncbi:leaf rust 10 disease-resistance locus receptor-like protein kinase [Sesbania bispinosa]|nr:leaf rust 10 disease-resistance locus receptor-like protein kinase [Sesbania bispinosa]